MIVFWIVALAAFVIIELVTVGLCSVWFAAGATVALISACLSAPIWLQILLFLFTSALSLALARPILVDRLSVRGAATSYDRVLQMVGVVTADINNDLATGAVQVDGKTWTARSYDGTVIPTDSRVRIEGIEGVKLIVSPVSIPAYSQE